MSYSLRVGPGALLILALGWLLAQTPFKQPITWALLRLDGLSVAMVLLVGLSAALALTQRKLKLGYLLSEHLLLALAICAWDLRLAAGSLLALGIVAGLRTGLAGGVQAIALGWLGLSAGAWRWDAGVLGAYLTSFHVLLLLLAVILQLGLLPGRLNLQSAPAAARRFWPQSPGFSATAMLGSLYLLLRLYGLGPINWGWTLGGAFAGGAAALWYALHGLGNSNSSKRMAAITVAWWSMTLATVTLASEAGIAATWSLALVALFAQATLQQQPLRPQALLTLGALPLTLPFAALWLAMAAVQAGGIPILAAVIWVTGILLTVGAGRLALGPAILPAPRSQWLFGFLSIGLMFGLPVLLTQVIVPLFGQLGAGLTPYGQPILQPWSGLMMRNAGSETVAVFPALILAGLVILSSALAFIILRIMGRFAAPSAEASPRQPESRPAFSLVDLWAITRRNLPDAPAVEDDLRDV